MNDQKIYFTSSESLKRAWQDLDVLIEGYLSINEKQKLDNIIAFVYKDGNIIINETEPFDEAEFEKLLNTTGE